MKAKVRLSYSVELFVEGDNEEAIQEWLSQTTPGEAHECAAKNGHIVYEDYDEEIITKVQENTVVDYKI